MLTVERELKRREISKEGLKGGFLTMSQQQP